MVPVSLDLLTNSSYLILIGVSRSLKGVKSACHHFPPNSRSTTPVPPVPPLQCCLCESSPRSSLAMTTTTLYVGRSRQWMSQCRQLTVGRVRTLVTWVSSSALSDKQTRSSRQHSPLLLSYRFHTLGHDAYPRRGFEIDTETPMLGTVKPYQRQVCSRVFCLCNFD